MIDDQEKRKILDYSKKIIKIVKKVNKKVFRRKLEKLVVKRDKKGE